MLNIKEEKSSCNFCTRKFNNCLKLYSTNPDRNLIIYICPKCAKQLKIELNKLKDFYNEK